MKKVFLLNRSPNINSTLHQTIAGWYMLEHSIDDPSAALGVANVTIKEYVSNATLRADYPSGLPDDAVVVMGGELADGPSTLAFDLFSEALKEHTIIVPLDVLFGAEAIQAGFKHILSKDGEIHSYLDLQYTIIKWLK